MGDSEVVKRTVAAFSAVISSHDSDSANKILCWKRQGLYVDARREGRKTATLWMARGSIAFTAGIVWAAPHVAIPGVPAKNVALWETIFYTFALFEKRQIVSVADAIREEFLDLMSTDDTFVDYIGRTTDKPDRFRYRADTWRQRLEAAVVVQAGETRAFSSKLKEDLHTAHPTCAISGQHIHAPNIRRSITSSTVGGETRRSQRTLD